MKCLYHLVGSFINQLRSVQLNSVSEKDYKSYHKLGLSKPLVWFSLPSWTKSGYALFPSGWICSTKAAVLFMICYWILLSKPWEKSSSVLVPDLLPKAGGLARQCPRFAEFHTGRGRGTPPQEGPCTPGASWHTKHAQKWKHWRSWGSGFGDREVSRGPWQGEPWCQVSSHQVGIPLGVLGTTQCWGVSASEQEKLKEYIIKHINK